MTSSLKLLGEQLITVRVGVCIRLIAVSFVIAPELVGADTFTSLSINAFYRGFSTFLSSRLDPPARSL